MWSIDATFKTNRYGLPLLHIIGVPATNCTSTFAILFDAERTLADYHWTMFHIREVFQAYGQRSADDRTRRDVSERAFLAMPLAYQQKHFGKAEDKL